MHQPLNTLIASLPWYDLPGSARGLDAFWNRLREQLCLQHPDLQQRLPNQLDRETGLERQWNSAGLILSQCCGPDLFRPDTPELEVIARPVFSALDCEAGYYFSHIISRTDKLSDELRVVANGPTSRSGFIALQEWLQQQGIEPARLLFSGSHQQSLLWIKEGRADLAAIDAHSWHWLKDDTLAILDRTETAPTPPYVMHHQSPVSAESMRKTLGAVLLQNTNEIGISGLLPSDKALYQACAIRPLETAAQSPDQSGLFPAPA